SRPYYKPSFGVSVEGNSGLQFNSQKQQQIIVRGNIIFTTYSLVLSHIEEEIIDLEAKECDAILKRDTAALKQIRLKDVTLNQTRYGVMISHYPWSYYASLSRSVENCNVAGSDKVYTSGWDHSQNVKLKGKLEEFVRRPFFQTYKRKNG